MTHNRVDELLAKARWKGTVPFVPLPEVATWLCVSARLLDDILSFEHGLRRFCTVDGLVHPIGVLWFAVEAEAVDRAVRNMLAGLVSDLLAGRLVAPQVGQDAELQQALEVISRLASKERTHEMEQLGQRTGISRATLYRKLARVIAGESLADRRSGRTPRTREPSLLHDAIEAALRDGQQPDAVAASLHVSRSTVLRVRKARFASAA